MQQRYYDPVIGRFYSNDPVGFTASNPMMFNRYAYANNNPYKFIDPDGRAVMLAWFATPPGQAALVTGGKWIAGAVGAAIGVGVAHDIVTPMLNESADPVGELVGDLKGDKVPVPGVEGERGGLMGTPEQAEADWDKIKNTEGAEIKDENNVKLPGGGHANRHPSTRPYPGGLPAGTDTIKVYKPGESTPEFTGRYPEEKKE